MKNADQNPIQLKVNSILRPGKILIAAGFAAFLTGIVSWNEPAAVMNQTENDFIRFLKARVQHAQEHYPQERLYVQTDKTFFEPGETIWISAWLRNADNLKASETSGIINAELINPRGGVEKSLRLIAKNGQAAGEFELGEQAPGGIYKIRAYTNWQKNDSLIFEKELTVQENVLPALKMKLDFDRKAFGPGDEVSAKIKLETNENKPLSQYKIKYVASVDGEKVLEESATTDAIGQKQIRFFLPNKLKSADGLLNIMIEYQGQTESVSRSIPILLNNINLSFFPEGGDLVDGLMSTVAFKAVNEFGKPADVEGFISDESGKRITTFSSFHNGMGSFELKPEKDQIYTAHLTRPSGIEKTFVLPDAFVRGYTLGVKQSSNDLIRLTINTTESEKMSIIGTVRGKVYYATEVNVKPGMNDWAVPVAGFPAGVVQFTLFDKHGIERAERLAFANRDQRLNISVKTDKEKYLPREKVSMNIRVTDERGLPMPAQLAVSVVDDQLLAFADDKQGHILSKLLLESDLKEKVEEPRFYFDQKESRSGKALDLLMMTSGWRRFTWDQILNEDLPRYSHTAEKTILAGTIYDGYTGKPLSGARLEFAEQNLFSSTNEEGKFEVKNADLSESTGFTLKLKGYRDAAYYVAQYSEGLAYYMYPTTNYNYRYKSTRSMGGAAGNAAFPAMAEAMPEPSEDFEMQAAVPMADRIVKKDKSKKAADVKRNDDEKPAAQPKAAEVKQEATKNKIMIRDIRFAGHDEEGLLEEMEMVAGKQVAEQKYHRARVFPAPAYKQGAYPELRTDFRSTVYWNPEIKVDHSGKAQVSFYNSDAITSFRVTAEGIGRNGSIGRVEKTFFTQMPFSLTAKIPSEVVAEDMVAVPLTLKNNTDRIVNGLLKIESPAGMELQDEVAELQTLEAGKSKTIFLKYKVKNELRADHLTIAFKACGMKDAMEQKINVTSKGFPVSASFSGDGKEAVYPVDIRNVVKGSLRLRLSAFPSVVGDLLSGVEGILREPGGCFEQTSMSSYPNAMVMDYLKTTDSKDEKLLAYAGGMLDRGYNRLITFETKEKGYEWFGKAPGHQGLTAYGLMQFNDLTKVYDGVDKKMINRTAEWILSQRDGKGGFKRNTYALHDFGRISDDVMNGYIVYALTEAGYGSQLEKEALASYETSMKNKDPYQLAMTANTLAAMGHKNAPKAYQELIKSQEKDGSFNGTTHSITHSTGNSLKIETTSIAILAMLKNKSTYNPEIKKAVEYLVKSRSGYGTFGNTQGTVLALKAMTEFAKANKTTPEDGRVEFYVDEKLVAAREYAAGEKETILLDSLERFVGEGSHDLKVKFQKTSHPLPHSVSLSWNTFLPQSSQECMIDLKTKLASTTALQGETVRLQATLKNKGKEELASPIAIIGIPAGLSLQPWQLKELQEKKQFDFYEVIGNNLVLYYRGFGPEEKRVINLDLKADIPGEFEAAASSAYLYYTNEHKSWEAGAKIRINKQS